jgi:hypothetical protein
MAWVIEPWTALVVQAVELSLNRYVLFRVDSWSWYSDQYRMSMCDRRLILPLLAAQTRHALLSHHAEHLA